MQFIFSNQIIQNKKLISLISGPLAALLILIFFKSDNLPIQGIYVAAITIWMAIWWITEATDVAITAFIPLVLFPILGINTTASTASFYAHPVIYLFLGGFIMSLAIKKSGLHKRFALQVLRLSGANASIIVGNFMLAAALISMWVSNTSTTLIMLPVAISIIDAIVKNDHGAITPQKIKNFEIAVFLGLSYGATLGGISTLVGTPPNAFMASFMLSNYNIEVDFARWMLLGIPLMLVMLPLTWLVIVKLVYPLNFKISEKTQTTLNKQLSNIGPITTAEIRTGILFTILIVGWIFRKPIASLTNVAELNDSVIAMMAGIAAFLIPNGNKNKDTLLNWQDMKNIPWGVLILFGGGLALAHGMTTSELTGWLGSKLEVISGISIILLIISSCILVIFLTELTSNLATIATLLPVMSAIAMNIDSNNPFILLAPVTLAASFAFMLPVATAPNAVVFSSGYIRVIEMAKCGLVLNIIGIIVISALSIFLLPLVFY